jgi:hypothetical protein
VRSRDSPKATQPVRGRDGRQTQAGGCRACAFNATAFGLHKLPPEQSYGKGTVINFTDEEAEAQRARDLPGVTQLPGIEVRHVTLTVCSHAKTEWPLPEL